jgi:hypothetical protein
VWQSAVRTADIAAFKLGALAKSRSPLKAIRYVPRSCVTLIINGARPAVKDEIPRRWEKSTPRTTPPHVIGITPRGPTGA